MLAIEAHGLIKQRKQLQVIDNAPEAKILITLKVPIITFDQAINPPDPTIIITEEIARF